MSPWRETGAEWLEAGSSNHMNDDGYVDDDGGGVDDDGKTEMGRK